MKRAYRAALLALLTVTALMLSYAEHLLPLPLPVPGLKLGLANIVTLFVLYEFSMREAAALVTVRCVLSALLFGGLMQLPFSLAGGLLAALAMAFARKNSRLTVYGVSIAGACAHNLGQVLAAMLIMGTAALISYLLFLWPAAIVTGAGVAFIYGLAARALHRAAHRE